jgi:hypothetical protein
MFDLQADWYDWYVNNKPMNSRSLGNFLKKDGIIYSVKIRTSPLPKNVDDVRQEAEAHLDHIIATCGYTKFAVLISGIDSEIIARTLAKKKVDLVLYHTKFWFKDDSESNIIKNIAKDIDVPYCIVDYDWKKDSYSMTEILSESLHPATVKNTHIHTVRKIPEDRYIFMGYKLENADNEEHLLNKDGIIDRYGQRQANTFTALRPAASKYHISTSTTLNMLGRSGCSIFWFNDKRTLSAMLQDKRTIIGKNGEIFNAQLMKDIWGKECLFKEKTNPFFGGNNTHRWEHRYNNENNTYHGNRAKALVTIQRRYLRMKYGPVQNVFDDIIDYENNNKWQFGGTMNIKFDD